MLRPSPKYILYLEVPCTKKALALLLDLNRKVRLRIIPSTNLVLSGHEDFQMVSTKGG